MLPYLITFAFVLILGAISQNNKIKKDATRAIILSISAIVLSIFGGLRSYDVGTDIEVYGKPYFEEAVRENNFSEYAFKKTSKYRIKDYGYLLTNFIISRVTSNLTIFLIALQLLTNIPIFILLYRKRNSISIPLSLLIYLCVWYGFTLNALRQSIAMSFMILGFDYYMSGKKKESITLMAIAILFHSTALYACAVQTLLIKLGQKQKNKRLVERIIIILVTSIVIAFPIVVKFLYGTGVIPANLYAYTNGRLQPGINLFSINSFISIVTAMPAVVMYIKESKNQDNTKSIPNIISIIGLITSFTKDIVKYSERFSYYFQYNNLVIAPGVFYRWKPKKNINKAICILLFAGGTIVYWLIWYAAMGAHETVPYKSIL